MLPVKENYENYIKYIKAYINRGNVEGLIAWLDTNKAALAPASAVYHLNERGGLVQHSLNVFFNMIKLVDVYGVKNYSKETIAIVSLLHDISKVCFYDESFRNVKDAKGKWEQVPYYAIKPDTERVIYGNHEETSLFVLQQFIPLTYEEQLAIRYHSGVYGQEDVSNRANTITAYRTSKLALLLNIADMISICVNESSIDGYDFNRFCVGDCEESHRTEVQSEGDTDVKCTEQPTTGTGEYDEVPF